MQQSLPHSHSPHLPSHSVSIVLMQLKAMYVSKGVALTRVGDSRRKVLATPLYSIEKTVLGQDEPGHNPLVLSSSLCHCAHNMVATPDSLSKLIPSSWRAPKGFGNYLLKPQALSRCHLLWQALPCSKKATLLPISFDAPFILQCSSQIWQPVSPQVGGGKPCSGNGCCFLQKSVL